MINKGIQIFFARLPAVICFVMAFILIFNGIKGSGWLLIAGFVLCLDISINCKDKKKNDK